MEEVTTLAGYTITIGAVASFLAQYVKKAWFPKQYRKILCRLFVAISCVLINIISLYYQGLSVDITVLFNSFFSYVVASASYDHIWS